MTFHRDHGVCVPISGILEYRCCFVAQFEGFALSWPNSADVMSVCLLGPRDEQTGKHCIGPEISPWPFAGPSSDVERVICSVLWREARSVETTDALAEAYADYDEARKEDAICVAHELRIGD